MKMTLGLLAIGALLLIGGAIYVNRDRLVSEPIPTASPTLSSNSKPVMNLNPQDITPVPKTVQATLKTNKGNIVLELDGAAAPLTVGNFVYLAKKDFYDGTTFHRVIPDFMIQGGDPLSKDQTQRAMHGTGDPGYRFKDEFNSRKIVRGSIAMANSGPGTNGSQFFIVVGEAFPHLDGKHTNFGSVTAGMDVVDAIVNVKTDGQDNPVEPVVVQDVIIEE